ncbi:MAG: tetratricopeptide repeat protein [Acidobacteria bacterium]|nr:tetratricopeptide repeat protein [Acidobacteriota bacterium]
MRRLALLSLAVIGFSAVLSTQAADPDALVRQGRAFVNQGKLDDAERVFRQALAINPRAFETAVALGTVLDLKGQYPEAQSHLQRAIDLAPAGPPRNQATNALALSFAFEGRLAEAQKRFEELRARLKAEGDPAGAAAAARSLGRIYLESGDTVNGRRWYELGYQESKPAAGQPESEQLLWQLRWHHAQGRISAREGRLDEAKKHLAEFESVMQKRGRQNDDNDIYRWLVGYIAYYSKEYDRAIAELARGNLSDSFVLKTIATAYEAKGDLANAREYYRRAIDTNVHNLQASIARPFARQKLASLR